MTTTVYELGASADDARQVNTGTVTIGTNSILLTGATYYGGFSFPTAAAPIAQGTVVQSATLATYNIADGTHYLIWKGHKVTNSAQFTETGNELSDRYTNAPTTASTTVNTAVTAATVTNVDVTDIVNELLAQGAWGSSSRITLIGKGGSGATNVQIDAWDGGGTPATLTIVLAGGGAMSKLARVRLGTKVGGALV